MNNIKSFKEFLNIDHLETVVYETEVNEGLRKMLNKSAQGRVKRELADEIEMSKSIMEGITTGLETLSESLEDIKKNLTDKTKTEKERGEAQKALDSITKILEDSKKKSWDLNELIDDGEVDYAGFIANVGMANVMYFGILFFPFRASMIIHKGYNYFFTLLKNTIRKALVMLQLNFDQFENLIITKSFQSAGYMDVINTTNEIAEYMQTVQEELIKSKKPSEAKALERKINAAKKIADENRKNAKMRDASESAFNCLDMSNNTYTKSLETLRQYAQEDVQKQLDAIKNSISKLGTGDVDLTAYGELIIATAEEHALKVSSSVYNKFAKMTEVFSLPNQQKLISLIKAANKEDIEGAEKAKKKVEGDVEFDEDKANEYEEEMAKIFTESKDPEGKEIAATLGELDKKKHRYASADGKDWTYASFKNLDDKDRNKFEGWLMAHPEVLKKCGSTLRIAIATGPDDMDSYFRYVDSLTTDIDESLVERMKHKEEAKEEDDIVEDSYILGFNAFLIEEGKKRISKEERERINDVIKNKKVKTLKDILEGTIGNTTKINTKEFNTLLRTQILLGEAIDLFKKAKKTTTKDCARVVELKRVLDDYIEYLQKAAAERAAARAKAAEERAKKKKEDGDKKDDTPKDSEESKTEEKPEDTKIDDYDGPGKDEGIPSELGSDVIDDAEQAKYYMDLSECDNTADIKQLYIKDRELALISFELIGSQIIKDKTFRINAEDNIDTIKKSYNKNKPQAIEMDVQDYSDLKKSIYNLKSEKAKGFTSWAEGHKAANLEEESEESNESENKESEA